MINTLKNAADYCFAIIKAAIISLFVGVTGGIIGGIFHRMIDFATELRECNNYLVFLLPFAGLVIVFLYKLGRLSTDPGTNRIISGVRGESHIPHAMAPLIFIATVLTHLFGGSAGREGAALQLGGSIGSIFSKTLKLDKKTAPIIILCGMSGVFSALFGTPLTAILFSLEMCCVGSMIYGALIPCLISSYSSLFISQLFGNEPTRFSVLSVPETNFSSVAGVVLLGIGCALVGILFCKSMKFTHSLAAKTFKNPYIRIFAGGAVIVALTFICGSSDYNGAGMDVIKKAMAGEALPYAFLLKILFTAITLGVGFKGGEIVPTFFVGATFGCVVGPLLNLPPSFSAAVAIVALFAAVVNCPVAALVLSIELFGGEGILLYAAGVFVSFTLSGYSGLYSEQKFVLSKQYFEQINRKTL